MRYQIGDEAWMASFEGVETSVECPDCGGTGRLRVTFHDDTEVSIGCSACSRGYEPPTGRIQVYTRTAAARKVYITGVRIDGDKTEWSTSDSYIVPDEDLFDDEAQCLAAAKEKAAEYDRKDRERVLTKEKDTRSWAWNATYHRREIKRAEQLIAYHSAKLAVASLKAKEDKRLARGEQP